MPFLTEVIFILLRSISPKYKIAMKSCNVLLVVWLYFELSAAHIYLTYRLIVGEKSFNFMYFFLNLPRLGTQFCEHFSCNQFHQMPITWGKRMTCFRMRHNAQLWSYFAAIKLNTMDCSGKNLQFSCFKLPQNLPTANFSVVRTSDGGAIFTQLYTFKIFEFLIRTPVIKYL